MGEIVYVIGHIFIAVFLLIWFLRDTLPQQIYSICEYLFNCDATTESSQDYQLHSIELYTYFLVGAFLIGSTLIIIARYLKFVESRK